jgi:hypothetical protein
VRPTASRTYTTPRADVLTAVEEARMPSDRFPVDANYGELATVRDRLAARWPTLEFYERELVVLALQAMKAGAFATEAAWTLYVRVTTESVPAMQSGEVTPREVHDAAIDSLVERGLI